MPYIGSYIWKIRQKIEHDVLLMPAADIIAVRDDGKVLLVHNKDFDAWVFPGGYAEEGQTILEVAARELLEEAGLLVDLDDLVPFAFSSDRRIEYPNGDVTLPFVQIFLVEQWLESDGQIDEIEVNERKWFSFEELGEMEIKNDMQKVIQAYINFKSTGKYQIIDSKKSDNSNDDIMREA